MTPAQALALLLRAEKRELSSLERWCPHTPWPKQRKVLDTRCRELLYGGSAGCAKSDLLMMKQASYAETPGHRTIIFRRTYQDLALPGALMDRSHDWYRDTKAHWDGMKHQWRFPSGASLSFGYLDKPNDHLRYKGAEFHLKLFDEVSEIRQEHYLYLFSRGRRLAGSTIPVETVSASNPGPKWLQDRFNIPEKPNFEQTYEHEGRVFIPGRLEDNPSVDLEEYDHALQQLDSVTYDQLRHGHWIQDASGLVYYELQRNLKACLIQAPPGRPDEFTRILSCDFGVHPDPTAFCVWYFHRHDPAVFLVESEQWLDQSPSETAELALDWDARHEGFEQIVGDTGGLGKGFQQEWATRFRIPMQSAEKTNKLGYIKLMNGDFKRGLIKIVEPANAQYVEDTKSLMWDKSTVVRREHPSMPNHLCDAGLYGWRASRGWAWSEEETGKKPDKRIVPREVQERQALLRRQEEARARVRQRLRKNPRAWMSGG